MSYVSREIRTRHVVAPFLLFHVVIVPQPVNYIAIPRKPIFTKLHCDDIDVIDAIKYMRGFRNFPLRFVTRDSGVIL